MPILRAKCTNCGAVQKVDDAKYMERCPECKATFVVAKAINFYNAASVHALHYEPNNAAPRESRDVTPSADFVIQDGTLVKYNGSASDVVVPDGVRVIGTGAFRDNPGLTSIVIPHSVTRIEDYAFANCIRLAGGAIANGLTSIGKRAFAGCVSLTRFVIPESVTRIGEYAFAGCTSLISITIPDSVTFVGRFAFQDCRRLQEVYASEIWKRRHWKITRVLWVYRPFIAERGYTVSVWLSLIGFVALGAAYADTEGASQWLTGFLFGVGATLLTQAFLTMCAAVVSREIGLDKSSGPENF